MTEMTSPQTAIKQLATGGLRGEPGAAWNLVEDSWPMLQRFELRRLCHGGIDRNLLDIERCRGEE